MNANDASDVVQTTVRTVPLGRVMITATAKEKVAGDDAVAALCRHARADWGDVCPEDREANEFALSRDLRLLSVYHDRNQTKFWIITEADRSVTTVLLPEDY